MKRRSLLSGSVALWLARCAAAAEAAVHPWEVFEISMTARSQPADPYAAGLPDSGARYAQVVFKGISGPASHKVITIPAFWDGGQMWRARFAPPAAGEWSYNSRSEDAGLNEARGTIECKDWTEEEKKANPARRGFVRAARHHFEYADGTPFLWIGDTWWNWSKRGIYFSTFQKLADDRAAKGFTVGQLFFAHHNMTRPDGSLDFEQIHNVERMIGYANSRGITVWIHAWWGGKSLADRVGAERVRRWWRYVLDRLAAYNVIWVLAGEYNMDNYSGLGLRFWKELGAMLRKEDPYRRIIGVHPTPPGWRGGADAPQWSSGEVLDREPWLDYNQTQVGHARWRNEMIPLVVAADYARKPAKPVVVSEPWYEFIEGNAPAKDIRFGAWSALLSGAAGYTYGGGHIWWAHVPEAPAEKMTWPLHREFDTDTLDYPGAVSVSVAARFLRGIEWRRLSPHPELVSAYAAKYCAADPGREYVVYVRWGGALELDLRGAADSFQYTWIDPSDGKEARHGEVQGGASREFRAPGPETPDKDWVLHVVRGTSGTLHAPVPLPYGRGRSENRLPDDTGLTG